MFLRDVQRLTPAPEMLFDPARSAILLFYNELLYKLLFDTGEDMVLFDFLEKEILRIYETDTDLVELPLRFLLRLSVVLGFFPENNYSDNNCYFSLYDSRFQSFFVDETNEMPRQESLYLSQLLCQDEGTSAVRHTRNNLLQYLIKYYKIHNEQLREIDSVEILSSILH